MMKSKEKKKKKAGSRTIKKALLEILQEHSLDAVRSYVAALEPQQTIHALFAAICRDVPLVRWHAITCMGEQVARLADQDMEAARVVMRRFLWSLNDESGGIGWGAPESMAEAMVRHEGLAQEYLHMFLSYMQEDGELAHQDGNYLEHELLQQGLLWGAARLSQAKPDLMREHDLLPHLVPYLESSDAQVRAGAALALGYLGASEQLSLLLPDLFHPHSVSWYEDEIIKELPLGQLVHRAAMMLVGEQGFSLPYRPRGADADKVCSLDEAVERVKNEKSRGRKVAFTNGCFDLLHAGHVAYLEKAHACADYLVVGINTDSSVQGLKGPERPIHNEQDRARVLAALGAVDAVILFAEPTPLRLITSLMPDVLVKGADWQEQDIVGGAEVKAAGGRVERIAFEYDCSTTETIKKIKKL